MQYYIIYDGNCNLCVTFTQILEQCDRNQQFSYIPMQDEPTLRQWDITPQDCEAGVILLSQENPSQRWQGSNAIEKITQLLPTGELFINIYHAIPGVKSLGDGAYEQIRDHRYQWFGQRSSTYFSLCRGQCSQGAGEQGGRGLGSRGAEGQGGRGLGSRGAEGQGVKLGSETLPLPQD